MHPARMKAIEKSNKKWLERSVEKMEAIRRKKGHPWKNPAASAEFMKTIKKEIHNGLT